MPGLDEYLRYIDKQNKAQKNGTADPEPADDTKPPLKNGKGKKVRLPEGQIPGSVQPGVRYVLKGGVTVAIPVPSERSAPPVQLPSADEPPEGDELDEDAIEEDLLDASPSLSETEVSDYLPPLVETGDLTEVPDAATRPRPARRLAEPVEDISDENAAALWKRLPRHIQLLVGMTPETKEEPAQKYYSRGFKETRGQLIERLLDPTMTLEDTARVLGVCPTTVRRYTNRGVLPHYRTLGQQRRFRLSDVLAFLEKQQKQAVKRRKALFGDNA